jgi:hypothetical protein
MFCPHCVYVFCIYLRTNSDLCHLQHELIGFYNRVEKCLLRGTDWVFKYSTLPFVFKGLKGMITVCCLTPLLIRKTGLSERRRLWTTLLAIAYNTYIFLVS